MNLRAFAKELLPPFAARIYRAACGNTPTGPVVSFSEPYPSWTAAQQVSSGYDSAVILGRVNDAVAEVRSGRAVFERDGVAFTHVEYPLFLLSSVLFAGQKSSGLRVLDFGGSLGSSYFQASPLLQHLPDLHWSVVEQPQFVEAGKPLEDGRLEFFQSIGAAVASGKPDIAIFSGVIEYLEHPWPILEEIAATGIEYLLFDRTSFLADSVTAPSGALIAVQKVVWGKVHDSYPIRLHEYRQFLRRLEQSWEVIFENQERAGPPGAIPASNRGVLLRRT